MTPRPAMLAVAGAVAVTVVISQGSSPPPSPPPRDSWVFEAVVARVVDGDTIDVTPALPPVRVRLLDCWAAERRTEAGDAATKHLQEALHAGDSVRVEIPYHRRLSDSMSFGRLLGRIWRYRDGTISKTDLSTEIIESGHATRSRER